jgi:hypothetical protein
MRRGLLFRLAVVVLPLMLAACEDADIFAEKKVPLPGVRKEVFPGGVVPGVDYNQPPVQPSNSNISVNTEVSKQLLRDEPTTAPTPPQEAQQPSRGRAAQQPKAAPRRGGAQNADPDDPWAGARSTE